MSPRWQPARAQQGREKRQRHSSVGSIAPSDDSSARKKWDDRDVNENGNGRDFGGNSHYEHRLLIRMLMNARRTPISLSLDFKRPVSANTVPAGLFKTLTNGNGSRSREIFEQTSRTLLVDLHVLAISQQGITWLTNNPDRWDVHTFPQEPPHLDNSHRLEFRQYEEWLEAILVLWSPSWTTRGAKYGNDASDFQVKLAEVRVQYGTVQAEKYIMLERINSERDQLRAKANEIQAVTLPRGTPVASSRTMGAPSRSFAMLKTLDMGNESQQKRFLEADNLKGVFKADKQSLVSKGTGAPLRPVVFGGHIGPQFLRTGALDDLRRANEQFEQLADLVSQAPTNEPKMKELWRVHDCNRVLEDEYVALQHRYYLVHSRHHLPVHTNFRVGASTTTKHR
ncbi:hypothetical protein EI94DRAFT_1803500 [Lactarius quietus]|nr:hypothetical protein EI94DRAFT_1803500 [Lactarius quietus]